jgi:hypothetical protein
MSRVIASVACSFVLAGCSGASFNLDSMTPAQRTATTSLRVESLPEGAQARAAQGQACKTPCSLNVPLNTSSQIVVELEGYEPQNVAVRRLPAEGPNDSPRLVPNPVYVELQVAEPPKPEKTKRRVRRRVALPSRAPTPAARPAGQPRPMQSRPTMRQPEPMPAQSAPAQQPPQVNWPPPPPTTRR